MDRSPFDSSMDAPSSCGVSFKPQHFEAITRQDPSVGWFEVHPENYMCDGGPPHAQLTWIRDNYPLSLHGVGLSVGGAAPIDREHLLRLKELEERYQPWMVSEHLAWSTHDGCFFNDLLPIDYSVKSLTRVVGQVELLQETLGRRVLIENPSVYLSFQNNELEEVQFLEELAKQSGCGLLLDLNNLLVSATNRGMDAQRYLEAFPLKCVGEIHLAGHAREALPSGKALLIDTHDRPVDKVVWDLFEFALKSGAQAPVLIEWDSDLPSWETLANEALRANSVMAASQQSRFREACYV